MAGHRLYSHPFARRVAHIYGLRPETLVLHRGSLPRRRCFSLTQRIGRVYRRFGIPFVPRFCPTITERLNYSELRLPLPLLFRGPGIISSFRAIKASVRSISRTIRTRGLKASCLATKRVCIASYGGKLPPQKLPFLRGMYRTIRVPICNVNKVGVSRTRLRRLGGINTTKNYIVSKVVRI